MDQAFEKYWADCPAEMKVAPPTIEEFKAICGYHFSSGGIHSLTVVNKEVKKDYKFVGLFIFIFLFLAILFICDILNDKRNEERSEYKFAPGKEGEWIRREPITYHHFYKK